MTTTLPSGVAITEENANEIMRIGGPYVGTISIDNSLISYECVLGNYIESDDLRLIFFVKHHQVNSYHYFTINFYNRETNTAFEFDREFDMVYLGAFLGKTQLAIYPAFHDKFPERELIFDIDKEKFNSITNF